MTTKIIIFLNIILAALLAGTSFGIWAGFNPVPLTASGYTEQQQNMLRSLNTLMVSMVFLATVITLISAFLQSENKAVLFTLVIAALFYVSCILISRFGNQPINNNIMTWTPDSLPSDWMELRDRWWSFHIMRTVAELVALCLVVWSGVKIYPSRDYSGRNVASPVI